MLSSVTKDDEDALQHIVFPIVFNYRHNVELTLKIILQHMIDAEALSTEGDPKNVLLEHKLGKLWTAAQASLSNIHASSSDAFIVKRITLRIQELDQYDPLSFSCRYTESKNGGLRKYPNDEPVLDVRQFCEGMNDLATWLYKLREEYLVRLVFKLDNSD